MKTRSKHTSLPWVLFNKSDTIAIINSARNKVVIQWNGFDSSSFPKQNLANAEFIVRAANCHDELVAALTEMVDRDMTFVSGEAKGITRAQVIRARAALEKAKAHQ